MKYHIIKNLITTNINKNESSLHEELWKQITFSSGTILPDTYHYLPCMGLDQCYLCNMPLLEELVQNSA
jgi:hypothetical protein